MEDEYITYYLGDYYPTDLNFPLHDNLKLFGQIYEDWMPYYYIPNFKKYWWN